MIITLTVLFGKIFSVANGECVFKYDRIGKNVVAFATDLVTMYSPDYQRDLTSWLVECDNSTPLQYNKPTQDQMA